jgi:hypothetical protein
LLKAIATIVFGGGVIAIAYLMPTQAYLKEIFLALLSAIWVLPAAKTALKAMFKGL